LRGWSPEGALWRCSRRRRRRRFRSSSSAQITKSDSSPLLSSVHTIALAPVCPPSAVPSRRCHTGPSPARRAHKYSCLTVRWRAHTTVCTRCARLSRRTGGVQRCRHCCCSPGFVVAALRRRSGRSAALLREATAAPAVSASALPVRACRAQLPRACMRTGRRARSAVATLHHCCIITTNSGGFRMQN
jgi:hypothetical protein